MGEIASINPRTELPNSFKYVDLESVIGTNLIGCKKIEKENAPSRAQRLASFGDIFYQTVRPYQRNNYLFEKDDDDVVFSTGYAQLRSELDSYFLFTLIQTDSFVRKVLDNCTGTSYPAINSSELGKILISVPQDKLESHQIGTVFRILDNVITLHQRKLEKLQATKKALLYELFPIENSRRPKRRFKGFTDDWEQRKLSKLATMNARIGWQNLRTSEFLDSGDYLLITGTDFDNGRIKYSTCHYVEKKRFDQDTKIQLSTGSILITKDGTLGKVALVEELPKPATLNAGVFNVRVKDDAFLSYKYLYHYLKAPFLMKYVIANATGGTIKHLNQSILVDFPIPITEKHEQDKIAKLLDSLESIITLHQRKLEKLKNLKAAYLNEMFV